MRMRWRHTAQGVKWNSGMFNQPLENKNQEILGRKHEQTSAKNKNIAYPNAPTASRKILSESKEARFSGLKVAVFRGCLSFCTASLFIPICKHFFSLKFKTILSLFIPICKHFFSLKFKSISFYMAGKYKPSHTLVAERPGYPESAKKWVEAKLKKGFLLLFLPNFCYIW